MNSIKYIAASLVALLMGSCTHEVMPGSDSEANGTLRLGIAIPQENTRAINDKNPDNVVKNLRILAFDTSTGAVAGNQQVDVTAGENPTLAFELTEGEYHLVAVCNETAALQQSLATIATRAGLDALAIDASAFNNTDAIPLVGEIKNCVVNRTGAALVGGIPTMSLAIPVSRLASRLHITVYRSDNAAHLASGISLVGFPQKVGLMGESGYTLTAPGGNHSILQADFVDKTAELTPEELAKGYLSKQVVERVIISSSLFTPATEVKKAIQVTTTFADGLSFTRPISYNDGTGTLHTLKPNTIYNLTIVGDARSKIETSISPWNSQSVGSGVDGTNVLNMSKTKFELYDGAADRIFFYSNAVSAAEFEIVPVAGLHTSIYYDPTKGEGFIDISADRTKQDTGGNLVFRNKRFKLERTLTCNIRSSSAQYLQNMPVPYVGTFHRWNEMGERLVAFYNVGPWTASVEGVDADAVDNVLIDPLCSPALKLPDGTGRKLYSSLLSNPELYKVSDNGPKIVSGNGPVYFRIGWKSTTGAANKVRYARVKLILGGRQTFLYLRQGEAADYLYAPDEEYTIKTKNVTTKRPNARRFDVYNVINSAGIRTDYPSQPGRLQTYSVGNNLSLWDSPENAPAPTEVLINDRGLCPEGYKVPEASYYATASRPEWGTQPYSIDAESEIFHSLWPTGPDYFTGNGTTQSLIAGHGWHTSYQPFAQKEGNTLPGVYADGLFDRYTLKRPTAAEIGKAVGDFWETVDAISRRDMGIVGHLLVNTKTDRSLFFPGAGFNNPGKTRDQRGQVRYWCAGNGHKLFNGFGIASGFSFGSHIGEGVGRFVDAEDKRVFQSVRCVQKP